MKMFVCRTVCVTGLLLNSRTDFDDIFCVCLSGSLDGLNSQLDLQVGPTRRVAQTGILRFTMDIFVYKWLLLVTGGIISRN